MPKDLMIEFAYKNICFMNFLENSLDSWNFVVSNHSEVKLTQKQQLFREKNDDNLLKYQEEENNSQKHTNDIFLVKKEKIREWALLNKRNFAKDITFEEINSLIDDLLFPNIINKLNLLKVEKNPILNLLFPQLINNLFASFDLLNKIKIKLFSKLKIEMNNYSNLLLKSNENEKELKKKINEGRNNLKQIKSQLEKERLEYENKINLMQGQIKNLKDEKLTKKNISEEQSNYEGPQYYKALLDLNSSLSFIIETLSSDIEALKLENKYLKEKMDELNDHLKNVLGERNQLKDELDAERKLRTKIMDELETERKLRNKLGDELETERKLRNKLADELETERKLRNKLVDELKAEKEQIIKSQKNLENELNKEKDERDKLQKGHEAYKIQQEKNIKNLINFLENNNNEVIKRIKETFNLHEKNK